MKTKREDFYWSTLCLFLILCIMLATSGCSMMDTTAVEISGKAIDRIPQDVGRFSAWAAAVAAQEATKQKEAEAETAAANAEKARIDKTTVVIDTPEKMAIASMLEMGRTMSKAIIALSKGDKQQATIPMPKGVIAESIDSLGGAVEKVANTPTAVATSVGVTIANVSRAAIKGAGDKVEVNGDENQVTTTKTKMTTIKTTTGAESPIKEETPAEVEVVEPVVEPVIVQ